MPESGAIAKGRPAASDAAVSALNYRQRSAFRQLLLIASAALLENR